ncbi:FIST C-terminal domain-containing protein [Propionivibrio sp.]|uniref:FIST C-terminal domain-containing protein n=1 Tax=Propionivibrio sp. TaxID=2212460 RepID=UPI00260AF4D3|nr:FIST C-terminal domain-containing protein [Propionivibrio sp.]
MTAATALVSGNDPLPQIAEDAIRQALAKAGLTHANGVLLFLTPEFARHAQHTITAAARAAQCTQVAGGIAAGVFTESGWVVDRPAAAVMVFGRGLSLGHPQAGDAPLLSYASGNFPPEWSTSGTRFGGSFAGSVGYAETVIWQQSRLAEKQRCSVQLLGADVDIGVSSGLRLLGEPLPVERSNGYDLERLGGQAALRSLNRVLPLELRQNTAHQLHQLSAVLIDSDDQAENALAEGRYRPLAIIAANADKSLTLTEHVAPGQHLAWAIRQTLSAEADMRQMLDRLAANTLTNDPVGALMFSCIGRGPFFYGGEDRDLNLLCERFPALPVLGTYATGQIAPTPRAVQPCNRQLQNAVVTALISRQKAHVQSIT